MHEEKTPRDKKNEINISNINIQNIPNINHGELQNTFNSEISGVSLDFEEEDLGNSKPK